MTSIRESNIRESLERMRRHREELARKAKEYREWAKELKEQERMLTVKIKRWEKVLEEERASEIFGEGAWSVWSG